VPQLPRTFFAGEQPSLACSRQSALGDIGTHLHRAPGSAERGARRYERGANTDSPADEANGPTDCALQPRVRNAQRRTSHISSRLSLSRSLSRNSDGSEKRAHVTLRTRSRLRAFRPAQCQALASAGECHIKQSTLFLDFAFTHGIGNRELANR